MQVFVIEDLAAALRVATTARDCGYRLCLTCSPDVAAWAGPGWLAAIARQVSRTVPDVDLLVVFRCDTLGAALEALCLPELSVSLTNPARSEPAAARLRELAGLRYVELDDGDIRE